MTLRRDPPSPLRKARRRESAAIRDAGSDDASAILALNRADVALLCPLDRGELEELETYADVAWVVEHDERVVAFFAALREGTAYDSGNYRWFAARYDRFLYVDRVVVAPQARGRGLGRALYERLFSRAERDGVGTVVCEYCVEPLNKISALFHASLGFREIGTRRSGPKRVSLQYAEMAHYLRGDRRTPPHGPSG